MKAKVWFTPIADGERQESLARKAVMLADAAGLHEVVNKGGLIGILQHVGEADNIGHIKPPVTRAFAERIRELGGKPFLTGSSTLYRGNRSNACDHVMQAFEHGFTPSDISCPIIMCDGLRGADKVDVPTPNDRGRGPAHIGSAVAQMQGLVALSHPTGHPTAGFGAAIKNVAMGLASRGGKLGMHHGGHPDFLGRRCTACGRCAQWCPENAIVIERKEKARLIAEKCIGCGQCLAVCPFNAIDFNWNVEGSALQERLADYCMAVRSLLGPKMLFVNVIQHFQKGCDCFENRQPAICPDTGIAASRDIIAVDAATADLLARATGRDIVREAGEMEYRNIFAYAEKIGLGSAAYDLIET